MLPPASYQLASCDPLRAERIRAELGCTQALAWVLARRGLEPSDARALVTDDEDADAAAMHDPMLLGDMAAAVERIRFAIDQGEQIVVHGDYDADGVCATTLLVEALEQLGAGDVQAFLPDRFANGYGLQLDQVERFARGGARLLIAVDCGITAVEAVAHARDLGLDVVICDHHQPGPQLPDAIICSSRPSDYPFPDICATVVASKLAQALGVPSTPAQHELEAIATVADCMPLVDENRAIVRRGLRALRTSRRAGLRALIDRCGLRPREVDGEAIGFKLAPRINAVGRIAQSELAYELLRAGDDEAPRLAERLDAANDERRTIERGIVDEAVAQVEAWTTVERDARIYVVHGRGWHEGVVGIVASRLVERYWRPVLVIADGDPARGSGRSIDGVDLHAALAACDDLLLRWGGHAAAGGVTVDPARIEELRARLADWGSAHIADELLAPRDRIDAVVAGAELRMELVQELERLAPFGTGWERPRLVALDARITDMRAVGGDSSHLKCVVRAGDASVPGIGFGMAVLQSELGPDRPVDVALRPSINRFRGAESLQVELDRVYAIPPTAAPSGWCAAACARECDDRIGSEQVIAAAGTLVPHEVVGADPDAPPAFEPLLARAGTVDLRHRGIGIEHAAQLLAGGASVLVLVADVSRRRDRLESLAAAERLGVVGSALASERCLPLGVQARLRRLASLDGARLVVCDHPTLEQVLAGPVRFDALVVLDPPATTAHRDRLAATDAPPLHLVFGAAEQRFAADALRAALDVRGTLGSTWKRLRDEGPLGGAQLDAALFGDGPHLHATSALVHGIRTLVERNLLAVQPDGRLSAVPADAQAASGSA